MRWLAPDRLSPRWLGALIALSLVATWAMARGDDARSSKLKAVEKTEGLLDSALETREAQARSRVRALYKLTRAGEAPLWLDPEARRKRVRWRGAARRIVGRDLRELALFRDERRVAARARARLEKIVPAATPARGSLTRPVPGAIVASPGTYRHRRSRAKLVRNGSLFASERGEPVVGVGDGVVVYAGPLRGLGQAVVVDHDGFFSVLGKLSSVTVSAGDNCVSGQSVGLAGGKRVYLEIRTSSSAGSEPLDPGPLLAN